MILTVGGVSGTGKSTFSIKVCHQLNIPHKIATGFIREIVHSLKPNNLLTAYTFDIGQSNVGYDFLAEQTGLLKQAINACVERAHREGTDLVIEGTHAIPWLLNSKHITDSVILYVDDEKKHRRMIDGPSHAKRIVSDAEFRNVRMMQEELLKLAKQYDVTILDTSKEKK